ncbi:MAG TPA: EVE domain-containing protein [Abditibacteriaceae bacterium]|jgi:predicted RNA-binding protein with PUA-like domain|nr:EVE domain-containing protein [Abditibacteriaceae bacterium]
MVMWLLKTEPDAYSYDDLERDGQTMWDGVTQPHALQNLRKIQSGDVALIYHTGDERAIVGLAEVIRGYYVHPEQENPKLAVCDVRAKNRLARPVTLAQIKAHPLLQNWDLVRLARLSVVPVMDEQWQIVRAMSEEAGAQT